MWVLIVAKDSEPSRRLGVVEGMLLSSYLCCAGDVWG